MSSTQYNERVIGQKKKKKKDVGPTGTDKTFFKHLP